jgi:hypothetical protein
MIDFQTRAREPAEPQCGSWSAHYDTGRNLILIGGRGFITPAQFGEMFAMTGRLIADNHAAGRPVRILVDNRQIVLHAASAAERLRQGAAAHVPGTRVAIIVTSSLARMQFRRILDMSIHALFADEAAAVAWLLERPA